MSLLRQRVAALRPLRQSCRAAGLATRADTSNLAFFDDLSGTPPPSTNPPLDDSSSFPQPSITMDPEDTGPPKGEAYPLNPIKVNESKSAEIAQGKLQQSVYAIYCKSNKSNTIVSATRPSGHILRTYSGGAMGFKGANRSSYEAGYQSCVAAFKVLEKAMETEKDPKWQLYLNGRGQGRDACLKAVVSTEGQVLKHRLVKVIDKTPIKIGGTRSKKMKRR